MTFCIKLPLNIQYDDVFLDWKKYIWLTVVSCKIEVKLLPWTLVLLTLEQNQYRFGYRFCLPYTGEYSGKRLAQLPLTYDNLMGFLKEVLDSFVIFDILTSYIDNLYRCWECAAQYLRSTKFSSGKACRKRIYWMVHMIYPCL